MNETDVNLVSLTRSALASASSRDCHPRARMLHLGIARQSFDRLVEVGKELRTLLEAAEAEAVRVAEMESASRTIDGGK